ncbi:hypothetical protein PIB30_071490 [Stylosanthes scabra]|uniref:Uncharacterized protein n=1 Tax=Stylosanthes scabra TaxID=79078 RepID=A0ABU6ZML6_9FABA|nr:hypothetical protein [Stylosanthes scabra]
MLFVRFQVFVNFTNPKPFSSSPPQPPPLLICRPVTIASLLRHGSVFVVSIVSAPSSSRLRLRLRLRLRSSLFNQKDEHRRFRLMGMHVGFHDEDEECSLSNEIIEAKYEENFNLLINIS